MKDSTYHSASEELHVKPPATKKQDELLEVIDIHVFNDNDNNTVQEYEEEGHPKVMEVAAAKQPTHIAMELKLVSRTTMEMVNLDHMKEFQECMDSYKIHNGVDSYDTIVLATVFYESTCTICLVVTKISANNYWQYVHPRHQPCNIFLARM